MNILDYIILVPLLYFTIKGIIRGLIREVASLAGIMLGIWLGMVYQQELSMVLRDYLPDNRFIPLISIALIFVLLVILCNLAGWGIRLIFKKASLGWFDRLTGGLFAVIKTIFLAYVFIIILTFYTAKNGPLISESFLAPWIIRSYHSITGLVSPDHYEKWKKKIVGQADRLNSIIKEKEKNGKSEE
ncbi:MAG: CvpA family protein [Deltaproteobacteria bacterium]|nr:CvpA family protein [Deltaproteobacteria bacterium]